MGGGGLLNPSLCRVGRDELRVATTYTHTHTISLSPDDACFDLVSPLFLFWCFFCSLSFCTNRTCVFRLLVSIGCLESNFCVG